MKDRHFRRSTAEGSSSRNTMPWKAGDPIPRGLKVPPLTRITRKRTFIPSIDLHENPFAQERQLSDMVASANCKPPMVVEAEVRLAKLEKNLINQSLPKSVFAPQREILQRKKNSLFGTHQGMKYLMEEAQKKLLTTGAVTGVEGGLVEDRESLDGNGAGTFLPNPDDFFKPPDKSYFPDPFEVATSLETKPPPATETQGKPTTFGHRPRSASRHFDPLTMRANRFSSKSNKRLPTVGLLSSTDLHRMLKGEDVVGMGPSPAERGEAPLTSKKKADHGGMEVKALADGPSAMASTAQSAIVDGPQLQAGLSMTASGAVEGRDGGSTGTAAVTSESLGAASTQMAPEITRRTNGRTILEREAPPGLVRAPDWMGGLYSPGLGRSLFRKTKLEKIAEKKARVEKRLKKKHLSGREPWKGNVYRPPPQRAFRSQLMEDSANMTASKDRISKFARLSAGVLPMPTCDARQQEDLRRSNDFSGRVIQTMKRAPAQRKYIGGRRGKTHSSSTPRLRHKHDIDEIMREVERRVAREQLLRDQEEEDEIWSQDSYEEGDGGDGESKGAEDRVSESGKMSQTDDSGGFFEASAQIDMLAGGGASSDHMQPENDSLPAGDFTELFAPTSSSFGPSDGNEHGNGNEENGQD